MLVSRERGGDARGEPQVRVSHAAAGLATGVDLLCSSGAGGGETRYVVVELKVGYATVQQFLLFFPFLHKTSIHVSFGFTVWDNEIIVYIAEPALFGLGHGKASNTRWVLSPTPHCVTGSFWKWTWKGIEHKAGLEPDSIFRNRLFLDVDRRNRQTSMVW
jgi:hypothetical protein